MSDYRRFVSYMYLYENKVKSMNAGFLKVESRHGQCRLNLSLKNVYSGTGRCQAYLFMRADEELRGIYLGDVQIKNHGSDWHFRTDAQNLAGSGYTLDHIAGMIIRTEGEKFYGTRWDSGELDIHRFVTEWVDERHANEIQVSEFQKEEGTALAEEENDEIQKYDVIKEADEKQSDIRVEHLEKMLNLCPGMYPFDDDTIEACVRLEPQDIGMMPLDYWSYGSNSFLLHGYYSYRHLILARMNANKAGQMGYILGVPGTQHSRDAFMAGMFGFRKFKPIRSGEEGPGNFGYWYTYL